MIPKDPVKLKSSFTFHYIEDENGHIPSCFEGIKTIIPLECIVEDGIIKLFGKQSIYKTKCFNLKFNNHNYGMIFYVSCNNKNEDFKGKTLWRRTVDKDFLHNFFHEVEDKTNLYLEGDAPEVPNCPPSCVKIELFKEKRDFHAVNFSLEMTLDTYDMFISRFSDL